MKQRRWLCDTCHREFLQVAEGNIVGVPIWTPDQGCPGCHSAHVHEVVYEPRFRGADIPRAGLIDSLMPAVSPNAVISPTPLALAQDDDEIVGAPV